jgi:D-alanyl-D-alanine dipeptidase
MLAPFHVALLTLLVAVSAHGEPASRPSAAPKGLLDVQTLAPEILVDLKYASSDNFMRRNVYGSLRRCYLQPEAARKLAAAARALKALRPDLRLLALDCTRPRSVQRLMWKLVEGTPSQRYVANPKTGSMHNVGCAVDLTLAGRDGKPLDLGTPFDHSGPRSQPRLELAQLKAGQLGAAALANRLLLRIVMVQGGFLPLEIEWWHFDCTTVADARKRFVQVP